MKINKSQKDEKSVSEAVLVSKMCLLGTNFGTKTAYKSETKNMIKKSIEFGSKMDAPGP